MALAGLSITHHDHGRGGKYVAQIEGETATGFLEWEARGDKIRVATHTVVPPAIGRRGVAAELVERLVSDAREQEFRIVPECSYVAAKFDQNPAWSDLRAD